MAETPEEQMRKLIIVSTEHELAYELATKDNPHMPGVPIGDFAPYLLIKILERLEVIEALLKITKPGL